MYENPGPLQFQGPSDLVDSVTSTLTLDTFSYLQDIKKLQSALASIQDACRYSISFINLLFHHFFYTIIYHLILFFLSIFTLF